MTNCGLLCYRAFIKVFFWFFLYLYHWCLNSLFLFRNHFCLRYLFNWEHPDLSRVTIIIWLGLLIRFSCQLNYARICIFSRIIDFKQMYFDAIGLRFCKGLILIPTQGLISDFTHAGIMQDAIVPFVIVEPLCIITDKNQGTGCLGTAHATHISYLKRFCHYRIRNHLSIAKWWFESHTHSPLAQLF